MGKKNFVENYDPLKAHLTRDAARSSDSARPVVQPAPQRQAVLPTQAVVPADEPPELEEDTQVPAMPSSPPTARRRTSSSGDQKVSQRKVLSMPGHADASPEMSARIKVSSAAFQDLEAMLSSVYRGTGSKVHYSIATRALWGLLVQAEAQVMEELRKANLGRLPSTRGRLEYAEYEERVKQAFANAFRKLPRTMFQTSSAAAEQETAEW